ncbi:tetratricopeptide repeat protein, partial [Enhygromyxa salina]|uniref:tetratricopeptide repeat protein n=1 Tax=Enhygromyxa salina TaxID=215803 RepID=UPI00069837F7
MIVDSPDAKDPKASFYVEPEPALFEGPGQAPARSVPHFKGRDNELAELEQLLLGDNRTVCVVATGIGGVGKTTLVEEFVATRAPVLFPDGAAWLDGSQLVSELGRVSRRFGWTDSREPTPAEAIDLLGTVLHTKPFLLVVDNYDPDHGYLGHVPVPGGQCRSLVTSRSRTVNVRLDAAALVLGAWTIEACREYLRERCPRLGAVADSEVDALAEFVGRLPLGVRLLVSMLSQRRSLDAAAALKLLEAQSLRVLDKYETDRGIAATFQVSYDALTNDGRRVLQALAVCAKQTRPAVVEAVAGVGDVGELLDDLHARGLAEFSAEADAPWGLSDVVRMFVVEQPGHEEFEAAHTGWARAHLKEHSEATAYQEFGAGVDEARRAFERLRWTDIEQAATIYRPLEDHLTVVGRYPEAIALSESLIVAAPAGSELAANAMNDLGICYQMLGDIPKAIDFLERSLAVHEKLGHLQGQANQLGNLGICYRTLGDIPKAIDFHERSLAIEEKIGRLQGQASALTNLGNCYRTLGDIPKAIDFHERSLAIEEKIGRLQGQASALTNLGNCYRTLGDIPKAIDFHERSLAIEEKIGRLQGQASALTNLGNCYRTLGDIPKAIDF